MTNNLHLSYLQKGDKIGLIAPARATTEQIISYTEDVISSWKLKPVRGKNLLNKHHQFSGTKEERFEDLQYMMDDPEIKAILCAGGGYGAIQLIEKLSYHKFLEHPKWLIGFSDITVLHAAIYKNTDIASMHATMPVKFSNEKYALKSMDSLCHALYGQTMDYKIIPSSQNIEGNTSGILIGGNLSILTSLIGTSIDIDYSDKILFIEEVDEYLYHIERMMYSLKLSGKLKEINGLVVGGFTDTHDNDTPFGKNEKQIILDAVKEYGYPVIFDFPAGHGDLNKALYLGRKVTIESSKTTTCKIAY